MTRHRSTIVFCATILIAAGAWVMPAATARPLDEPKGDGTDGAPLSGPRRDKRRAPPDNETEHRDDDQADTNGHADDESRGDRDRPRNRGRRARMERLRDADSEHDDMGGPDGSHDDRMGGAMDGPFGDGPRDHGARRLTDEQVTEAMDIVRRISPATAERIESMRDKNPQLFERLRRRLMPLFHRILEAEPEMQELLLRDFQLQFSIDELARRVRRSGDQKDLDELKALVAEQFDVRIQKAERMLNDLEKRIAAQRQSLVRQKEDRQMLIDRRLEDLQRDGPPPRFPR